MIRPVLTTAGLVYLPAMVFFMPVEFIADPITRLASVRLLSPEGTPWQGRAQMLTALAPTMTPIEWQFEPDSLLALDASWSLTTGDTPIQLTLPLTSPTTIQLQYKAEKAEWPAMSLSSQQLQVYVDLQGNCRQLNGEFNLTQGRLEQLSLPPVRGSIRCKQNDYYLSLSSPDKQSALKGELIYQSNSSSYQLHLKWRVTTDERSSLRQAGYNISNGYIKIERDGYIAGQ
ncbi:MAG: type II secretion system protein N [Marinobacterium sp.]|nr:type II secretion system protein N [Marinobacterium sp.]